jgi:hypothetical protein
VPEVVVAATKSNTRCIAVAQHDLGTQGATASANKNLRAAKATRQENGKETAGVAAGVGTKASSCQVVHRGAALLIIT